LRIIGPNGYPIQKYDSVIKTLVGQKDEVIHRFGGGRWKQLYEDIALVGLDFRRISGRRVNAHLGRSRVFLGTRGTLV